MTKLNLQEVINLKQRGYSNTQIAGKYNVSYVAIHKALKKAKERGLWNGESGTKLEDETETLENEKIKSQLKPFPNYRCPRCRISLTPLDEIQFKQQDEKRVELILEGYTHMCLKCLVAYEKSRINPMKKGACPDCEGELELANVTFEKGSLPVLAYYCSSCEVVYDKSEVKELRKNI